MEVAPPTRPNTSPEGLRPFGLFWNILDREFFSLQTSGPQISCTMNINKGQNRWIEVKTTSRLGGFQGCPGQRNKLLESSSQIPWLGDIVDSGIGLSTCRTPEPTKSPSQGLRIWIPDIHRRNFLKMTLVVAPSANVPQTRICFRTMHLNQCLRHKTKLPVV